MLENIKSIQKTLQTTSRFIKLMMDSGEFNHPNDAFLLLRACLKALRDRVEPHEAIHLGSQLPALLRGFYFEGWKSTPVQSRSHTSSQFLEEIKYHLKGHDSIKLETAVPVTMKVILDLIDQGEAVQVLHNIPKDIRELCP